MFTFNLIAADTLIPYPEEQVAEHLLGLNSQLLMYFEILHTYIPGPPPGVRLKHSNIGPKEVLIDYFTSLPKGIDKYLLINKDLKELKNEIITKFNKDSSYILTTEINEIIREILTTTNSSKKKAKKSFKQRENPRKKLKKEITKLRNNFNQLNKQKIETLKKLYKICNNYLIIHEKFINEFTNILSQKSRIPIMFLLENDAYKLYAANRATAQRLVEPFDNYMKYLIDFFEVINMKDKSLLEGFIIDFSLKSLDGPFTAYSFKESVQQENENIIESITIKQPKSPLEPDYIAFEKLPNGTYKIPFIHCQSKRLTWFHNEDIISQLHTNLRPASSGFLFVIRNNDIRYYFYEAGTPALDFPAWETVDLSSDEQPFMNQKHPRFHTSYMPALNTFLKFIEYQNIDELKLSVQEIKDKGYLDDVVIYKLIAWLTSKSEEPAIGPRLPDFYPKQLRRLIEDRESQQEASLAKRADHTLRKELNTPSPLSMRDPGVLLKNALSGSGAIGDCLFNKCVNWYLKREKKRFENKLRKKGSHRQAVGVEGEATQTIVPFHGKKKASGVKKSEVRRWFELSNGDEDS